MASGMLFIAWVFSTETDRIAPIALLSAFAALLFYSALYMVGGSTRLRVGSQGVDVQRRLLGVGPWQHVPASQIADVEVAVEMTYGKTVYYQIRLLPRAPKPSWTGLRGLKAGARIRGRDEAERIAARLRARLGLQ